MHRSQMHVASRHTCYSKIEYTASNSTGTNITCIIEINSMYVYYIKLICKQIDCDIDYLCKNV